MNSFNHYSYGSIGEWLYQYVAGIAADEDEPGFGKIIIRPYPSHDLKFVNAEYKSIRGVIKVHWEYISQQFVLNVLNIKIESHKLF